jgi:hypothetical protein
MVPITAGGTLPIMRINEGKKASAERTRAAGKRTNLDAHPVDNTIPGLNEKFTGPTTPRIPDRTFINPLRVTPLLILPSTAFGFRSSVIDSMDPKSFMDSPRKQNTKEIKTPVSKAKSFLTPEKKPETRGS